MPILPVIQSLYKGDFHGVLIFGPTDTGIILRS